MRIDVIDVIRLFQRRNGRWQFYIAGRFNREGESLDSIKLILLKLIVATAEFETLNCKRKWL